MTLNEYIDKIYSKNEFKCNVFSVGDDLIYTFVADKSETKKFNEIYFNLSDKNVQNYEYNSFYNFIKLMVFEVHKYFIDTIWIEEKYFKFLWDKLSKHINYIYNSNIVNILKNGELDVFVDIIWDIIPNYENIYKLFTDGENKKSIKIMTIDNLHNLNTKVIELQKP